MKIRRPVIFKFLLLGKASKFAQFAKNDEFLKNHYSSHSQKYVVFEFDNIQEQEKYVNYMTSHPAIKRLMKMKLLTIE